MKSSNEFTDDEIKDQQRKHGVECMKKLITFYGQSKSTSTYTFLWIDGVNMGYSEYIKKSLTEKIIKLAMKSNIKFVAVNKPKKETKYPFRSYKTLCKVAKNSYNSIKKLSDDTLWFKLYTEEIGLYVEQIEQSDDKIAYIWLDTVGSIDNKESSNNYYKYCAMKTIQLSNNKLAQYAFMHINVAARGPGRTKKYVTSRLNKIPYQFNNSHYCKSLENYTYRNSMHYRSYEFKKSRRGYIRQYIKYYRKPGTCLMQRSILKYLFKK